MLGEIVFGGIIVASVYLAHRISKYGKRYVEDTVITELSYNPDLQQKIKDMFGWR